MRENLKKGFLTISLIIGIGIIISLFLFSLANKEIDIDDDAVVYFYSKTCSACNLMTPVLQELEAEYGIKIVYIDVASNRNLFGEYIENYNITENIGVPAIFFREHSFIGYSDQNKEAIKKTVLGEDIGEIDSDSEEKITTEILGFWNVGFSLKDKSLFISTILLGVLDSLNICSLTVLVFLIIFTLSTGSVKRAFKSGIVFVVVIYIFYFSFMVFLTSMINSLSVHYGIHIRIFVIMATTLAGILLIKDFFFYGKWINLKIPVSAKPLLEKYIKQATLSSVVILGVLASIVELPCTINFPLAYSAILIENMVSGITRIIWIAFYNLIYVLPLLIIVFGTYFSWVNIQNIDEKIQKHKKTISLIAGLALLLIALYFALPFLR